GGVAGIAKIGVITRVANAVVSCATYLWETFWPHNLAVFYPYPQQLPWLVVVGAAALLAFISVVAVAGRRSFPYFIVGWLWFLGMLTRSEEHTSELQSLRHLVCRLLLEKKKKKYYAI